MFNRYVHPAAPVVALAAALAAASFACGAEPFALTASGSSLPDLVSNLITTKSEFASFDGAAFRASLDYAGVRNAIRFQQNASGASDVRDKIRDFLLKDGTTQYARLLRTVNERSLLGVTDGNPLAATATLA